MSEEVDTGPVPVRVHGPVILAVKEYEIVGHGYTLEPGGTIPFQLLPEDFTRVRAVIASSQVLFVGDKQQLQSLTTIASTGTNGPGARFGTGVSFIEIEAQNELWGISSVGTVSVGVWVERRIPRN